MEKIKKNFESIYKNGFKNNISLLQKADIKSGRKCKIASQKN